MRKPRIGITMGDPSGIGPEITLKALQDPMVYQAAVPIVIGSRAVLELHKKLCRLPGEFHSIEHPREAKGQPGFIDLLDLDNIDADNLAVGKVSGAAGRAAYEYIHKSIQLALEKQLDTVVTGPINKESLQAGGVPYIGHTEMFGELTGTPDPLTMFEVQGMRIFFLSRHVSLREACDLVTKDRLMDYIARCTKALERLGVQGGSMAVAGLNPHSGDGGLFGQEEINEIIPAVTAMQAQGYSVVGPVGADSVFHLAREGHYTSVLSLYHDQGHIAAKTLDFHGTVAITNGLPFLRASVDHGTAFDIAGKNKADASGTIKAITVAASYTPYFRDYYRQ